MNNSVGPLFSWRFLINGDKDIDGVDGETKVHAQTFEITKNR